jgi:glycosyltransferase involved in cell wall biosynthesis
VFENLREDAFNSLMAGSAFVVVPLKGGVLEAGGRQVFQNAMTMGKAVIVTDASATDYITNGVTGLLVPPDGPRQLREAVIALASNPTLAQQLGYAAQNVSLNGFSAWSMKPYRNGAWRLVLARMLLKIERGLISS